MAELRPNRGFSVLVCVTEPGFGWVRLGANRQNPRWPQTPTEIHQFGDVAKPVILKFQGFQGLLSTLNPVRRANLSRLEPKPSKKSKRRAPLGRNTERHAILDVTVYVTVTVWCQNFTVYVTRNKLPFLFTFEEHGQNFRC